MKWTELSLDKKVEYNRNRKIRRHALGISREYGYTHKRLSDEQRIANKKIWKLVDNLNRRKAGIVNKHTVQLIYEDNIKKHGTLTCYLCDKPIEFGNDNVEHIIPISRGGSSVYSNLGISCKICNLRKHTRTPEEFALLKKKESN